MADDPRAVAEAALKLARDDPGRLAQRLQELARERQRLLDRLGRLEGALFILEAARDMAAGTEAPETAQDGRDGGGG